MTRKNIAFAILLLLLAVLFSGAAGAEEPAPATSTDLDCAHPRTKTTIYFFDSPAYTSLNAENHRVYGPAEIETACADCGKVLASETVSNAEEIRRHVLKKGVCVLCGYRAKAAGAAAELPADVPEERTLTALEDENTEGLLVLTLTKEELYELASADVRTVLVKGAAGNAAVALNVSELLSQTEKTGAGLQLQMAEREDGSLYAGLYLVTGDGEKIKPDIEGIALRFYRPVKTNVRASLAPAGTDTLIVTDSVWSDRGFWSVAYVDEGTYFLLQ